MSKPFALSKALLLADRERLLRVVDDWARKADHFDKCAADPRYASVKIPFEEMSRTLRECGLDVCRALRLDAQPTTAKPESEP